MSTSSSTTIYSEGSLPINIWSADYDETVTLNVIVTLDILTGFLDPRLFTELCPYED